MTSLALLLWIVSGIVLQLAIYLGIGFWRHWQDYQALRHRAAEFNLPVAPLPPVEAGDTPAAAWPAFRTFRVERKVVEDAAHENRDRVNELVEMPQTVAKDTVKKANDTLDKYSEQVLTRVHLPTVEQIETMTKKVGSVERKLDKVIKENAAAQQI